MKGLFFSMDAIIAFIIILAMVSFSFSFLLDDFANEKEDYKQFSAQADLVQVSELMVTNSRKGLVVYENNLVKHHQIRKEYWNFKGLKNFDRINYGIEVLSLREKSSYEGESVSRIALCGSELCVVKITRL